MSSQIVDGAPISRLPALYAAPPTPVLAMTIPEEWLGDRRWLQVSTGYFVPPVTSFYLFAPWHKAARKGGTYLTLSSSADPSVSPLVAYTTNKDELKPSKWLELEGGKLCTRHRPSNSH